MMWKYFKCQQCGECCKKIGLPYDYETVFKMADFLKMSVEEIIENYYGKRSPDGSSWKSVDSKRTPCPFLKFLDGKYFCEIYPVRPTGCKLYPVQTDGGHAGINCPAWKIASLKLEKEQQEEDV